MDWFALTTLKYVVGFGRTECHALSGEAGSEVDDSEPSRTDHLTLEYKEISP